jgi:hypothetical protein
VNEGPHSLILEHLRAIRGSQDRMEHDIKDLKFRVGQIEHTLAEHGTTLAHYTRSKNVWASSTPDEPGRCPA